MITIFLKRVLLSILIIGGPYCLAQNAFNGEFYDHGPKTTPITPEAFSFIKYGYSDLNYNTGQVSPSIPLYTCKSGDIEVPIELKYTSGSGIKVSDEASWVGLGWDLQFGSIVQITNDRDDFSEIEMNQPDYFCNSSPSIVPWTTAALAECENQVIQTTLNPASFWCYSGYWYPKNCALENFQLYLDYGGIEQESEPDVFVAQFFKHSLKFIIDPKSHQLKVLDARNYKVVLIDNDCEKGWRITAPDGIVYYFEEVSHIQKPRVDWVSQPMSYGGSSANFDVANLANQTNFGTGVVNNIQTDETYISRNWRITKIKDTNNNQVLFNYGTKTNKYDNIWNFTWRILDNWATSDGPPPPFQEGPWQIHPPSNPGHDRPIASNGFIYHGIMSTSFATLTNSSNLTEIVFDEGKLLFITSDRIDYTGSKKLDRIELYNVNNTIVSEIEFNYDYFSSAYTGFGKAIEFKTYNELTRRLKLIAVQKEGEPAHEFTYSGTNLPPKNSIGTDFWGYYNGRINNNSAVPNFLRFGVFPSKYISFMAENTSNHSADLGFAEAGIIKEIAFPTGGQVEYEYELNEFDNQSNGYIVPNIDYVPDLINPNSQNVTKGFGLRIKSQKQKDAGGLVQKINYSYQGGKSLVPPLFVTRFSDHIWTWECPSNQAFSVFHHSQFENFETSISNFNTTNSFGSSNCVGYSTVVVTELNASNNACNGQHKMYFQNIPEIAQSLESTAFFRVPTIQQVELPNGSLLSEEFYKQTPSNQYELVKKVDYDYAVINDHEPYYGVKHCLMGLYTTYLWNEALQQYVEHESTRKDIIAYYPLYSHYKVLEKKTETMFSSPTEQIVQENFYYYYPDNLLTKEVMVKNNNNDVVNSVFYYPFNAGQIAEYTSEDIDAANLLTQKNMFDEVLKVKKSVNNIVQSEQIKSYRAFNGLVLPFSIKNQNNNLELYETYRFLNYDIKGNLQEYVKGIDEYAVNLWGYNYGKVIAEIKNATYNEILANLPCTYGDLQTKSEAELISIFNNLRTALPNASITSFTYIPLVGVSTITQPNKLTTYYIYDSDNRLKYIKNHFGEYVNQYDYHYRTQNIQK